MPSLVKFPSSIPNEIIDIIVSYIDVFKDLLTFRHLCNKTLNRKYTANFYCSILYSFIETPKVYITYNTSLNILKKRDYIRDIRIHAPRYINFQQLNNLTKLETLIIEEYGCIRNIPPIYKSLTTLICPSSDLSDNILNKLPNLTKLNCKGCYDVTEKSLSILTNLTALTSYSNNANDLTFIKNLKKLEHLYIDYRFQNLSSNIISNLTSLKSLEFNIYKYIDPNIIRLLPNLEYIKCNNIIPYWDEDIMHLSNLKHLITGIKCEFTDISFKQLTKLEKLEINGQNINISNDILSTLTNLTELSLGNLQLDDNTFINMKKLKTLNCDNSLLLTDKCLINLSNLISLHCGNNINFTDEGLSKLLNLQILHCGENTNFTIDGIYNLPNLKQLSTGKNINFSNVIKYYNGNKYAIIKKYLQM